MEYGDKNDCLGRYKLRVIEIQQSIKLIYSLINLLIPFLTVREPQLYTNSFKFSAPNKAKQTASMESVIHDFKMYSEGFHLDISKTYVTVESPRGRYGVTLVGGETDRPLRLKLRSPGFYHLQGFNLLSTNELISNILTILGSIDVIMGEVDK